MSYPYPQDRHRDRKEKGDQPYKDAKEAFSEAEARQQARAEAFGESRADEDEAERAARQQREAEAVIADTNESLKPSGDKE